MGTPTLRFARLAVILFRAACTIVSQVDIIASPLALGLGNNAVGFERCLPMDFFNKHMAAVTFATCPFIVVLVLNQIEEDLSPALVSCLTTRPEVKANSYPRYSVVLSSLIDRYSWA